MHSEDDDSSQASSKNLASLFENSTGHGGNSSLMYKAPKQPKSAANSSPARSQVKAKETLNLILLKVVRTYKFVNNAYVDQGRVGLALSGNVNTLQYQLTLYKETTSHLAQAQINSHFWFAVQPNNYAIFRDRNNILWSILFDDSSSLIEFSKEIALARWARTVGVEATLLSQDLYCVACSTDEKKVGGESRVEIALLVATISPAFKLDKEIETKEKCMINVSKNDSWSSCLVGLVKGSRKLIILPPHLQGKWKQSVQQNESIALEVEVLTVEPSSTLASDAVKEIPSRSSPNVINVEEVREDQSSTNTSNDSDSRSTHAQTSLISRMAKVGQALPFKGARVPDLSDSEDEVAPSRPADILKGKSDEESKSSSASAVAVFSQESAPLPPLPSSNHHQVIATVAPASFANVATSPSHEAQFSVFFSELRTNNSELRMGMNRITDKLERVLDKIEVSSLDKVLGQLKSMETNMVSQFNIVEKKNMELINSLKEDRRINSSEFQQPNSVDHLLRENKELQEALSQCSLRAQELQERVTDLNGLKSDLNQKLMREQQNKELIDKEHSSVIVKLQSQLGDQERTIAFWSESLGKIRTDLERRIEKEKQKMAESGEKSKTVRRLMNDVYKKLYRRFPDSDTDQYGVTEIHDAIRDIIKATTLEYLNEHSKHEREGDSGQEVESRPSVSTKNKIADEKDNTSSGEQESTGHRSRPSAGGKDEASTEHSSDENRLEVNSNEDFSSQLNDQLVEKIQNSSNGSSSDRKQKDSELLQNADLPTDNGQSISYENGKKNNVGDGDQCATEASEKSTKNSSEENWSSKQPPPLFDDEESESDDGWLN